MPPESRIGMHVKRVEQEIIATKTAALRPFGLTVAQYAALVVIRNQPGTSAAAIARACLVTPQTMATVLANLESKQLVTRRPHPWHRNATELALTPAGRQRCDQADAVASGIEERVAAEFTASERDQLLDMLARVSVRLAAEDGAAPANQADDAAGP